MALSFILCTQHQAMSQNEMPILPTDPSTGMYLYTGEVQQNQVPLQELKDRCQQWIDGYYQNMNVEIADVQSNYQSISFKAFFQINPGDQESDIAFTEKVQYTFYVNCKNNSYTYEVGDIRWAKAFYYPIEKWAMEKNPKTALIFKNYLIQTDAEITDLLISFRQAMSLPSNTTMTATW
ncbi:MAG TPA: DUF4468 domain-containing protein [Bacteroidia bacterium]|nr:DUF4468 domain-containing protein [Bacteroidia bacterium]HNT79880.1 DUF4468 domain-containing protein [Bacteroidia bacterium]